MTQARLLNEHGGLRTFALVFHAHVVVGKADATAHGGHLVEGLVRPTLEIVMTETPAYLRRRFDPQSGIALIDPGDREERRQGVPGDRETSA